MSKIKSYEQIENETADMKVSDPAVAYATVVNSAMPDGLPYANIENGTLQVSQDIEAEIAEVERGEIVSMNELNSMFAKWLD